MPSLTIVSGSPGTGKTTISKELARRAPGGVHIESDEYYYVIVDLIAPSTPESRAQNDTVLTAVARAAAAYYEGGYDVVIEGVIGPWYLPLFVRELGGVDVDYIVLRTTIEDALERVAARQHSQEMAMSGGLNHDGADERVANAAPDPPQGSGPPDAGFAPAAWCENVTYSTGFPESQVATKLYQQWRNSAPHQACMTNSSKNVGAVGIYYDGSTWWA